MKNRMRTSLIVVGAIVVLAAAAFVGLSLLNPNLTGFGGLRLPGAAAGPSDKKQTFTYNVIPATEMPATNPDIVGRLEQKQDNSLMVRPDSKGAPAALVEVVIASQTRLYRNATGDFLGTPPASGTAVQMVLVPYSLEQVAVGDSVIAWGQQRGDRLVAEVVMVETSAAPAGTMIHAAYIGDIPPDGINLTMEPARRGQLRAGYTTLRASARPGRLRR